MKKIILTLSIAAASFTFVQAQDHAPAQSGQQTTSVDGEGIEQIDVSELPETVNEGMKSSEYKNASIKQAYKLSGMVVSRVLGEESMTIYSSRTPDKLYLLQVNDNDVSSALYFTEDGELYASTDMDM